MADQTTKTKQTQKPKSKKTLCSAPQPMERQFSPQISQARVFAVNRFGKIWNNGTQLRYFFFNRASDGQVVQLLDGSTRFISWKGTTAEKRLVRQGFEIWKDLGIGLDFVEVSDRSEAEVRIGFMAGDGHWSYLGRDVLEIGPNQRTMNLDEDIRFSDGIDTVLHEIGHTLGLSHEHQNPKAGIKWNEAAVYQTYAQPPNEWDADTTYSNILKKLPSHQTMGTDWDKDSIMHYPFDAGLILEPERYQTQDLTPAPGLSARDKSWVKHLYPPIHASDTMPRLRRYDSRVIGLEEGDQFDALYVPKGTDKHTISTFGKTDLVLTVFEDTPDGPRYLAGDDDGGLDQNAKVELKLMKGKRYIVRTRLYFNDAEGEFGLMVH